MLFSKKIFTNLIRICFSPFYKFSCFLFPWKNEFEYIWILTNATISFLKFFFTNLLRISSSLFTKNFMIFLFSQKIEFEYIWILTNETTLFWKKLFSIYSEFVLVFLQKFPDFLFAQRNQIWIDLNFNQWNNVVFEKFLHQSAHNLFWSFYNFSWFFIFSKNWI